MRSNLTSSSFGSIFRRRQRSFAVLALLAVCLQLVASGIGMLHAGQRLEAGRDIFAAADICHGTAGGEANSDSDSPLPALQADNAHCPFCRLAMADLTPQHPVALSFPPPEPAAFFVLSADSRLQPYTPEMRHAPKHAPPFSFA